MVQECPGRAVDLEPATASPPPAELFAATAARADTQAASIKQGVIIHINPNIPNIPTVNPISIPISNVIIICSARRSGAERLVAQGGAASKFVAQVGAARSSL